MKKIELDNYLAQHAITIIGNNYSDIIVDNFCEFVQWIFQNDFYIYEILWWDRLKINSVSNLGYGGHIDPRDVKFFWAETDINRFFNIKTQKREIMDYIEEIIHQHPKNDLWPSFTVRNTGDGSLC